MTKLHLHQTINIYIIIKILIYICILKYIDICTNTFNVYNIYININNHFYEDIGQVCKRIHNAQNLNVFNGHHQKN